MAVSQSLALIIPTSSKTSQTMISEPRYACLK